MNDNVLQKLIQEQRETVQDNARVVREMCDDLVKRTEMKKRVFAGSTNAFDALARSVATLALLESL